MPKLPIVKSRELVRVLEKLGFFESHRVGSHAQFKHCDGRRITIPIHKGKDIKGGILRGIIKDIDFTVEEFVKILKGK